MLSLKANLLSPLFKEISLSKTIRIESIENMEIMNEAKPPN